MAKRRHRGTRPGALSPASAADAQDPAVEGAVEDTPSSAFDLLLKLLPELTMVLMALAVALYPQRVAPEVRESLSFVVFIEVVFCLGQGTLTDIATRLRARPPWWMVLPIVGALLLVAPQIVTIGRQAFVAGWAVFLPFAWSLLERLRELWTMPTAPRLEKLRRRALVSGRISLVLVVSGAFMAAVGVSVLRDPERGGFFALSGQVAWWLAAAFGLAAFDVARVHRPSFARRPRALFGRFDPLGVGDLSPL